MKRLLSILLCAVLISSGALALNGSGYPVYTDAPAGRDTLNADIDGQKMQLSFDPDPTYSNVGGGYIQACFFCYDDDRSHYSELYLTIPMDVKADTTITPSNSFESGYAQTSVSLSEVNVSQNTEDFYIASAIVGVPYPDGTDFSMHIDSVSETGDLITVSGSFTATMNLFKDMTATGTFISVAEGSFDFTIDRNAKADSGASPSVPGSPAQLPDTQPAGKFTLPENYAIV